MRYTLLEWILIRIQRVFSVFGSQRDDNRMKLNIQVAMQLSINVAK